VGGQLPAVVNELLSLTAQQSRCGLDRPDEPTQARLRDLFQAVVDYAPKAASRPVDSLRAALTHPAGWRLAYTNSEMFDFYKGVTGLANVFPAAAFESLSVQYSTPGAEGSNGSKGSKGCVGEAQYVEKLTTPLGGVDATVFATWDLVKEMSFMTNENSVVLRSYCTKVSGQ
jgi:hypothetical protein